MAVGEIIQKALLCKTFKCLPSELDKEDTEEMDMMSIVYQELGAKNPFFYFM